MGKVDPLCALLDPTNEPLKLLAGRKKDIRKILEKEGRQWHAVDGSFAIAAILAACGRTADAAAICAELHHVQGVDEGGNGLDTWGAAALALSARLARARGDAKVASKLDAQRAKHPGATKHINKLADLRAQLVDAKSSEPKRAFWAYSTLVGDGLRLAAKGDAKAAALVDEVLAQAAAQFGGKRTKPPKAGSAWKPASLRAAAAAEPGAIAAMLVHVANTLEAKPKPAQVMELMLGTGVVLASAGRHGEALGALNEVTSPKAKKVSGLGPTWFSCGQAAQAIVRKRTKDATAAELEAWFGTPYQGGIDAKGWREILDEQKRETVELDGEAALVSAGVKLAGLWSSIFETRGDIAKGFTALADALEAKIQKHTGA
jgi:hypothetical protein